MGKSFDRTVLAGDAAAGRGHWRESGGEFSILAGSSLIAHCEPHFHETYIIAFLRNGSARIQLRDRPQAWRAGEAFVANPYEIVSGGALSASLDYDVCYPSQRFMTEVCGASVGGVHALPRLAIDRLAPETFGELADILRGFTSTEASSGGASSPEQALFDFVRRHPELVEPDSLTPDEARWVRGVCRLIEDSLEDHVGVADLAARLDCDRFHLVRVFRKATGLPPSSYIRQLRLARALELIRNGGHLAETAHDCGFADQAHLTREFKRIYGTTPGQLARDISASASVPG